MTDIQKPTSGQEHPDFRRRARRPAFICENLRQILFSFGIVRKPAAKFGFSIRNVHDSELLVNRPARRRILRVSKPPFLLPTAIAVSESNEQRP